MKKVIAAVVLLAIIWAIPAVRNRVTVAVLPLLEKLGPVGDRIADPARAYKARSQQAFYIRMLEDDDTEGRALPTERNFSEWVDRKMPQETGIDPWGRPYWLKRQGTRFTVGSDGPDGQRDTDDDVTQEVTL